MGRTQVTYRMRLQQIRDRLISMSTYDRTKYKELWEQVHQLSAPSSTLPYPDTHAIATFCMMLDVIAKLNELKYDI